jgi:hypothetical protein
MSIQDILNHDVHVGRVGQKPDTSLVDTSNYDHTDNDNDDDVSPEEHQIIVKRLGFEFDPEIDAEENRSKQ